MRVRPFVAQRCRRGCRHWLWIPTIDALYWDECLLGRRSSERPRAKPFVHSKQDIHDQDFLHEDWSFPGLFRLRNHLNKSRDQLKAIAQELNPMYTTFTGSEVCSRKFIVTSGLSSKTSGNLKPIGFANFPHEDKQDYICYDATHLLQYQFDEVLDHILD